VSGAAPGSSSSAFCVTVARLVNRFAILNVQAGMRMRAGLLWIAIGCGTPLGAEHAAAPGRPASSPALAIQPPSSPDAAAASKAPAASITPASSAALTSAATLAAGPTCARAPDPANALPRDSREPRRRQTGKEVCTVADDNLTRAEAEILKLPIPRASDRVAAWDHRTPLERLPLITQRFGLDPDERRRLERHGFVAAARLRQPSYAWAYHEIYQSQLPIYISLDSILHAVYASRVVTTPMISRRTSAP
jgi:hypothetical protein